MISTWTFDSEVNGPYSRVSRAATATSVPTETAPVIAIMPPTP